MDKNGRRNFLRGSVALALAGSPMRSVHGQEKFDLLIKNADVLERQGKVQLRPYQTVIAGVSFGRPYNAPFSVR